MIIVSVPKISIIVPCYNVEKYVVKCLDSLVKQTFTEIEIVAVNDGSTDRTSDILDKYAKKDSRIVIINQKNQGLSGARNTGIEKARGKYVILVDGDDWIDPETCVTAYNTAINNDADVVMWSYVREYENLSLPKIIFNEDIIFEKNQCKSLHRRFVGLVDDELTNPENFDSIVTAWGKMYKRQIIIENQIKYIDLKKIGTFEDGLFNLEYYAFVKKAVFINKCFNHYLKTNSTALTQSYKPMLFQHYKALFGLIDEYISSNNLPPDFKTALNNRICYSLIGLGLTECIKNNPKNTFQRIKFIETVLKDPVYRSALKQLGIKYFPVRWKVFYSCAKLNFATGIYMLLLVINRIIQR